MSKRWALRAIVAFAMLWGLLYLVSIATDDTTYLEAKDGPALFVSSSLVVSEPGLSDEKSSGSFSFPTLQASSVSNAKAWWCIVTDSCTVIVAPPKVSDAATSPAASSVRQADRAATLFAAKATVNYTDTQFPKAPGALSGLGEVQGPSAGLATALYLVDVRTKGDLTAGFVIAATGTIEEDGTVGTVGGVGLKSTAVEKIKAEVFFVPVENEADVNKEILVNTQVVPVRSLGQAVQWLCDNGSSSSVC